ncbi:MAG: RluA family pseudouridine synthase [Mogibacterium sp.]|nr:RluA family pseudouridine synthase [Mogibacterium sp.]
MKEIKISANDAGRRLDRFLRKYLKEASLGEIYKFIRKDVKVDGKRRSESYILKEGEMLSLYLADEVIRTLSGKSQSIAEGICNSESRGSLQGFEGVQKSAKSFKSSASVRRNFDLVYEDGQILIASKPYGLLTHGDRNEKKNHLANRVKDYLIASGAYNPRVEKVFTPAPVNRLDRNTTGIVLFGKTSNAMRELTRMIRDDEIRKFYLTIACGEIAEAMHLTGSLVKNEEANKVKVAVNEKIRERESENVNIKVNEKVSENVNVNVKAKSKVIRSAQDDKICHSVLEGAEKSSKLQGNEKSSKPGVAKDIETIVRPIEVLRFGSGFCATLCEVELVTGRSHQIRAHLASIGHPLIGDSKYALRKYKEANDFAKDVAGLSTQLLHAYKIEFSEEAKTSECLDYLSGKSFECSLPKRFGEICSAFGARSIACKNK